MHMSDLPPLLIPHALDLLKLITKLSRRLPDFALVLSLPVHFIPQNVMTPIIPLHTLQSTCNHKTVNVVCLITPSGIIFPSFAAQSLHAVQYVSG